MLNFIKICSLPAVWTLIIETFLETLNLHEGFEQLEILTSYIFVFPSRNIANMCLTDK
jgi:hypothetical protein